jgi:guanine deaminase
MIQADKAFLTRAIQLATNNIASGGGPFGAVLVRESRIIAESVNQVVAINDPTAHAEIQAIRQATGFLKTFDLSGYTLYTSCEPCPMCLGAIYWARISRVVYASNRKDAEAAGFRDAHIYQEIKLDPDQRMIPFEQINVPQKGKEFADWIASTQKMTY